MDNTNIPGSPARNAFAGRRRGVSASARESVRFERLPGEPHIPLVIRPAIDGVDLVGWASEQTQWISELILTHRALLFRGFHPTDADPLGEFARRTSGELLEYRDRSTPRESRGDRVYTSTVYPAREHIHLHNEGTYWITWPLRIHFFCRRPPTTGGETPIADVRRVLAGIDADVADEFRAKQVRYVRNYNGGCGLPWQEVFQTCDKSEVEAYCRRNRIDWEWLDDERLRTSQIRPAFRVHPHTCEELWFNHGAFFHLSARDAATQEALTRSFSADELPFQTYFGDGTPIAADVVRDILDAYRDATIAFPWQQDDLLLLDNMTIAHGRRPFDGEREILTAMTCPHSGETVTPVLSAI